MLISAPNSLTDCRRFFAEPATARQRQYEAIDMSAHVAITEREITVRFHRRAHLPIVLASGLFDKPVAVPWCHGLPLRFVE